MAYTPLTLKRVTGHGMAGPSLWHYSTADAMATVDDTDYFAGAKHMGMNAGDLVFVLVTTGPTNYLATVSAIDSDGNATVSAGTAVT